MATLTTQVEATNVVVRKLEEKERILQNSLATVEKELALRQQAMEMHKRKAIESAQSAADLKLHLGKIISFKIIYAWSSEHGLDMTHIKTVIFFDTNKTCTVQKEDTVSHAMIELLEMSWRQPSEMFLHLLT